MTLVRCPRNPSGHADTCFWRRLPASVHPQINGTRVRCCTNRWCRGALGLWYSILTDRSVAVNFAPMLLIWLAGSIQFWCIDLTSLFFDVSCGTGCMSRCRSWQSLGAQEPWSVWGQRDVSDCFYFDCVEMGHFWYSRAQVHQSICTFFHCKLPRSPHSMQSLIANYKSNWIWQKNNGLSILSLTEMCLVLW